VYLLENGFVVYNLEHYGSLLDLICIRLSRYKKYKSILIVGENKGKSELHKNLINSGIFDKIVVHVKLLYHLRNVPESNLEEHINNYYNNLMDENGIKLLDAVDIITTHDSDNDFSVYLALNNIPQTLLELYPDQFLDISVYDRSLKNNKTTEAYSKLQKKMGVLCGENTNCRLLYKGHRHNDYFDRSSIIQSMTQVDRNRIFESMWPDFNNTNSQLLISNSNAQNIFNPYPQDCKVLIYLFILDFFFSCKEPVFIKPHPESPEMFNKYVPNEYIIDGNIPIDFLELSDQVHFKKVVTINSTGINYVSRFADKSIELGKQYYKIALDMYKVVICIKAISELLSDFKIDCKYLNDESICELAMVHNIKSVDFNSKHCIHFIDEVGDCFDFNEDDIVVELKPKDRVIGMNSVFASVEINKMESSSMVKPEKTYIKLYSKSDEKLNSLEKMNVILKLNLSKCMVQIVGLARCKYVQYLKAEPINSDLIIELDKNFIHFNENIDKSNPGLDKTRLYPINEVDVDEWNLKSGHFTTLYNKIKWDFFVNYTGSDYLYVFVSGKASSRSPFQRWSWNEKDNVLCIADPLLTNHSITLGWYIGDDCSDYRAEAAKIIKTIAGKMGVSNDHIIVYGSSGGGTASIFISSYIENSISVSINPQFNILRMSKAIDEIESKLHINLKSENYRKRVSINHLLLSSDSFHIIFINSLATTDMRDLYSFSNEYNLKLKYGINIFNNLVIWIYSAKSLLSFNGEWSAHNSQDVKELYSIFDYFIKNNYYNTITSGESYLINDLWKRLFSEMHDKLLYRDYELAFSKDPMASLRLLEYYYKNKSANNRIVPELVQNIKELEYDKFKKLTDSVDDWTDLQTVFEHRVSLHDIRATSVYISELITGNHLIKNINKACEVLVEYFSKCSDTEIKKLFDNFGDSYDLFNVEVFPVLNEYIYMSPVNKYINLMFRKKNCISFIGTIMIDISIVNIHYVDISPIIEILKNNQKLVDVSTMQSVISNLEKNEEDKTKSYLGMIYQDGIIVGKDLQKAYGYYKECLNLEWTRIRLFDVIWAIKDDELDKELVPTLIPIININSRAKERLSRVYIHGRGAKRNLKFAAKLLSEVLDDLPWSRSRYNDVLQLLNDDSKN